ncbi:MAG TPA: hypothetical protein DCF33_03825 [Saprospirales bacterium]|nr:hypothetical protein [Saprospirales bacterium]
MRLAHLLKPMMRFNHSYHWLFLVLLCHGYTISIAQDTIPSSRTKSIFEVLIEKDAAKMTLECDLTSIIEQKKTNQYFPATLRTADGKSYKIEVKPRGKFRRKIAAFPPIKIKFKKKELVAEGLDTLNEIKLVLPCYESEQGDELIVREYLAYRMFESLTVASLRARLIRITIRDTHVEKSKPPMYAILLEDEEELVSRLNGTLNEEYGVPADSLNANQAALAVMFEYMIGNTDWEISMQRNVRLVKAPISGKSLVIPYDFDFSGLVGAPYATPSSETGLKSVKDRFLMSNGINAEHLRRALNTLKANRQTILGWCKSKYLSYDASEEMKLYLRGFFEKMEGNGEMPTLIKMDID